MTENNERVEMPGGDDESQAQASPLDASEGLDEAESPEGWADDEPVPGSSDSEVQT